MNCINIEIADNSIEFLNCTPTITFDIEGGASGVNGWTPQIAIVSDGARSVMQVTGWTGGTGAPPTSGLYIGATGLVSNIVEAINIRGEQGAFASPPLISIIPGSSISIPAGKLLKGIAFEPAANLRTFSIGTTPGGTNYADAEEIPPNEDWFYDRIRYTSAGITLHFSLFTGAIRAYII